jgi:DNA-binding transcriptional ArsR family regulator
MTRRPTPQRLTLDAILPHLRTKRISKRNGERHVLAYCPAHDDQNASLSLTEKADGTLLWKCFAGCSQEAVQRELERLAGIERETAHPIPPSRRDETRETAEPLRTFGIAELADAKRLDAEKLRAWGLTDLPDGGIEIPYRDTNGNTVAIRYRLALDGANRFRWRQGDTPCLYGLWRLDDWEFGSDLYLCEGETDALTLWHAGLPALGIPGATAWKPEWWRNLWEFGRIVIIPDADKAGEQMTERLVATCPGHLRERMQVLRLPEGVKDANELWQRVDADPERFKEALGACEIRAIVQLHSELHDCTIARNDSEDDLPLLAPLSELLANDAERELEYVPLLGVDGLIARGTLTLLGAHPKAGKTTLLIHACREWLQQGLRVVYLSEDSRAVWRERVKRFPELSALILNAISRAHPENWVRAIRELEQEPDIVIVDTIRRFTPAKDENDSASVSLALTPFVDLTEHLPRTAIVLVHHTKKSLSGDGEITDIAGSHAFTAEVDAILLLAPVREHKRQRILTPIAGRLWTLSPEPLVLELSEDGSEYRVVGTAEEVLPETHTQSTKGKILDALRVLGLATVDEVSDYLRAQGEQVSKRTIHHHLTQLHAEGAVNREGRGTRAEPYTYSCNRAIVQPLNTLHDCTNCDLHETARMEPPAVFQNRTPYVWDLIDDFLQRASNPEDPFHLEPAELESVRVMLAHAEARGFPSLVVDGYTIHGDMAGWLTAAQQLAGTPAIARATRMLHALDASGTPHAPTTHITRRNGDASLTPSQLSLEEV